MKTDDTVLLDCLEAEGRKSGLRWVCRNSTQGDAKGMRLHQLPTWSLEEDSTFCLDGKFHPTFATPREALADFLAAAAKLN